MKVRSPFRRSHGQAMTEFVIAATFVLIPLFIFIPLLGKYIDLKHSAIQSARYQAWEYTVWYDDSDERGILDNFNSGIASFRMPEKSLAVTQNEARVRTMSTVGSYTAENPADAAGAIRPLEANDKFRSYTPNTLWTDHRGLPFFTGTTTVNEAVTDDDTPTITLFGVDVGSWLNTLVDVVQIGFDAVSAIINLLDSISRANQQDGSTLPGAGAPFSGSAGFSAMNTDGYTHVDFDVVANVFDNVVAARDDLDERADYTTRPLGFNAKAGVLADGWNAGGTAHTYLQVGGTTPSTLVNELLNLPGLSQIWDLISFIAPELSRCDEGGPGVPPDPLIKSPLAAPQGHLWLGYVDGDVVHPDRLSVLGEDPDVRLGAHVCDDSGRCVWDDTVQALDPPLSHSPCRL
ncbi:MAG: hypothetical protein WD928_02330 [Gammaproteobacteria bacterium]